MPDIHMFSHANSSPVQVFLHLTPPNAVVYPEGARRMNWTDWIDVPRTLSAPHPTRCPLMGPPHYTGILDLWHSIASDREGFAPFKVTLRLGGWACDACTLV